MLVLFADAPAQPSTPTDEAAPAEAHTDAADVDAPAAAAAPTAPTAKPKSNPFGSARPVDTVSKEKEFEERERRRRSEEEGASLRAAVAAAPVIKRPPGESSCIKSSSRDSCFGIECIRKSTVAISMEKNPRA